MGANRVVQEMSVVQLHPIFVSFFNIDNIVIFKFYRVRQIELNGQNSTIWGIDNSNYCNSMVGYVFTIFNQLRDILQKYGWKSDMMVTTFIIFEVQFLSQLHMKWKLTFFPRDKNIVIDVLSWPIMLIIYIHGICVFFFFLC